jgi:hypothetical protein
MEIPEPGIKNFIKRIKALSGSIILSANLNYRLMKNLFLTILLFSLIHKACLAQITVSDLANLNNVPQFEGGEQALHRHFLMSIRYPMMLNNSQEVCSILGVIKISKKGEIEEVGTLNKVPEPVKDEFVRAAKLTAGRWKPSNDTSDFFYVVKPIEFSYSGANYHVNFDKMPKFFKEPMTVVAYSKASSDNASQNNYTPDSRYIEMVNALISEKKYPKAIEIMEYLLSRQPLNPDYYSIIIDLYGKSGIKEQADFYTALLEIISK